MKVGKCLEKYRALVLALIAFVVITVIFPFSPSAAGSTSIKLFGYVMDMNNSPLANAFVGVCDQSFYYLGGVVGDEEGYYEFFVEERGTYYLDAQHFSTLGPYMHDYIRVPKTIETGESLEIRIDFNMRPAGNIVLQAYDKEGKLVRNTQFTTLTGGHAYVTDLDDLPNYAVFWAIHDNYSAHSSSPWDLAIPAFLVSPQTPNKMHVQWEVPEFGKVILPIDNAGIGYSVDEQGGKVVLNFNHEATKSKVAALESDYELFKSQGYHFSDSIEEDLALSKEHLATAEEYLSQVPIPDMEKAVSEFDMSLKYALWAHEQLHLEKAEVDIEKNRKGNARLTIVVDEEGTPILNCAISFQQISHDFLFGVDPMGRHHDFDPRYASLLKEARINYSYIICTWEGVEPNPRDYQWGVIDAYQNIQAQLDKGFKLMGGLALWFYRGSGLGDQFCPEYQDDMTFQELKGNIYDHMYTLASRYKGKINTWEINEQNLPWTNVLNLTWNQKLETYRVFAKAITDANPDANVLYDSCALPYEFNVSKLEGLEEVAGGISFPEFLGLVLEQGIPVDVIGLEFYYSGANTDGYTPPGLDLVSISDLLDQYSDFGKSIFARELSAPSTQLPNSSWWHRPWDEETQAEYVRKFYTIAFSKPLVREIGWSYGVSDEDSFIITGGLLDAVLNPKLSYFALKNLIDSWTTSGSGITDENGEFEFRGFAGDYDVNIKASSGQSLKTTIHLSEQITSEYTIEFSLHEPILPCFIATAAYGMPMAEEIEILREFRDEYLLTSPLGRALVDLYYKVSPLIAEFITEHPRLKPIVRAGLLPVVVMSTIAVNTTPAEKTAIAGLVALVSVAVAIWVIRRRGRDPQHS
jgi:GH35 family endo-1,4-beta-xylanase